MKSLTEIEIPTLILGGGLAGISTAYHLPVAQTLLVEREKELGGLTRSFKIQNFTFDFTGHLLHLHHPQTKKLITKLLKGNFYQCVRKAWIHSRGVYTRYPFQANTHGLPDSAIDACVLGFLGVVLKRKKPVYSDLHFKRWCYEVFGAGIAEEFMLPYNQKLYQFPLEKMTVDWCGQFVPKVELDEVIRGALDDSTASIGYNTKFIYPRKGGIQVLSQIMGEKLHNISLTTSLVKLDWKKKRAHLSDGRVVEYKNLVNTISLKEFLNLTEKLPSSVLKAQGQLKSVGIMCINIGVNRPRISDASWIYFPERKFPFYRVGFPMNFTPHVVPRGASSMYVEVPMNYAHQRSPQKLLKEIKNGLIQARILKQSDRWLVTQFLPIPTAYILYDDQRIPALKTINNFLESNHIQSIGRYGGWKYSFMEEAILDGIGAAKKIRDREK